MSDEREILEGTVSMFNGESGSLHGFIRYGEVDIFFHHNGHRNFRAEDSGVRWKRERPERVPQIGDALVFAARRSAHGSVLPKTSQWGFKEAHDEAVQAIRTSAT